MLHRVDELADDQQSGVAGVVVDVLQTLVHDAPVIGGEHIHLISGVLQQLLHHAEVDREHLGHQEGVLLLHFLGKEQAAGFIIHKLSHFRTFLSSKTYRRGTGVYCFRASMAAIRERMRMRTAPRLLMSSIFSWV